ncbi:MAG: UDP-glucose 4-epimerase GalE [Prochlorococcaceae cyanobacterium]
MNEGILLITGGCGFIGSHTCVSLLSSGYSLIVLDSLINSQKDILSSVAQLTGLQPQDENFWKHPDGSPWLYFIPGDLRNPDVLNAAFTRSSDSIAAVVHFAGLKSVGESTEKPLDYWDVNVSGTITLLKAMSNHGCQTLVFSSSAAVYGEPKSVPIPETAPITPANPYARTKATVEQILQDLEASMQGWRICLLRYFNPIGAHPSGLIGENPKMRPTNLFPVICQVAQGIRPHVEVLGTDWPTPDGSGIRDFIHVLDLADGHKQAIKALLEGDEQLIELNLGTGRGYSVFELIRCCEQVTGRTIPTVISHRRPGDVAVSIADPSKAQAILGWSARRSLEEMCRDGWKWLSRPHS